MHVFLPDRVEVGVRLVHRRRLLRAHPEGLVVGAGERLTGAQLGDRDLDVDRFALHPLQVDLREPLGFQSGADLVVGEDGSVVALGELIKVDRVVLH